MIEVFRQAPSSSQKRRWMPGLSLLILSLSIPGSGPARGAESVVTADQAYLGVSVKPIAPEVKSGLSLANAAGLTVEQVVAEGPAAAAGIQAGDTLVRLDDQWLFSANQLRALVHALGPGQPVRFELSRAGESLAANVVLGRVPPNLGDKSSILVGDMSWESWNSPQRFADSLQALADQGASVASAVSPLQVSPSLGVDLDAADTNWLASLAMDVPVAGVVTSVAEDSFGEQAGVRVNDVLVSLNGLPLFGPDDLQERMERLAKGDTLQLEVVRDGALRMLDFKLPDIDSADVPVITTRRPDLISMSWVELIQGIERDAQVVLVLKKPESSEATAAVNEKPSAVEEGPQPEEDTYIATDGVIVIDIQETNGERYATITTPTGGIIFRGMIDLPEEREKLPLALLRRVEALLTPGDWRPSDVPPGGDLQVRELPGRLPAF